MSTGLRLNKISIGFVALAFGAIGCGGGSGGVSLSNLGDDYEQTMCELLLNCGMYPDLQTCRDTSYLSEGSDLSQLEVSVEAGRANYDSDMAAACLAAYEDVLASCDIFAGNELEEAMEECEQVFTGNVEVGGECYSSEECAGDAYCEIDCAEECCAGVCVAEDPEPPPVGIGQDCSEANCVDGAWCKYDEGANTSICEAVDGEGDACEGYGMGSCGDGLICDGYPTGTCKRPAGQGETCDPALGYGFYSCARLDNWCDPSDTTCKTKPGPGEACGPEIDNCIDYAYCSESVCVQLPGLGGACGGTMEISCMGDLQCEEQVCVAPEQDPICGQPV